MKLIPISKTDLFAKVDDVDYQLVSNYKWHFNSGYARTNIGKTKKSMHQILLKPEKGQMCDHQNGEPLDNRRINLRICSSKENMSNRRLPKNNKSGYKGVCFHKQSQKWVSQIFSDRKHIWLGFFKTTKDAAHAYDKAALKYHGAFARLNFPL